MTAPRGRVAVSHYNRVGVAKPTPRLDTVNRGIIVMIPSAGTRQLGMPRITNPNRPRARHHDLDAFAGAPGCRRLGLARGACDRHVPPWRPEAPSAGSGAVGLPRPCTALWARASRRHSPSWTSWRSSSGRCGWSQETRVGHHKRSWGMRFHPASIQQNQPKRWGSPWNRAECRGPEARTRFDDCDHSRRIRDHGGNGDSILITQRSLVQIQPPQPRKARG